MMPISSIPSGALKRRGRALAIGLTACAALLASAGSAWSASSETARASTSAVTPMSMTPALLSLKFGASGLFTVAKAAGTLSAKVSDKTVASVSITGSQVKVQALKAGSVIVTVSDGKTSLTAGVFVSPAVVTPPVTPPTTAATGSYALVAWNDLGMHCVDGKDYSVFSILPPYNNLHAQLVNTSTGKQVTSGVTLSYESVADAQGSINTVSSTKTNFWQYVKAMFGASPATDVGLTGNPAPSAKPANLKWNATQAWFEADGIPITPYDDKGLKNFYPMVKVVAKDGSGKVLATAQTVLPVSDEMTCKSCHSSVASGNAAQVAAKPPLSGWANDVDAEKDWKKNILRLHDDKKLTNATYKAALATLGFDARGLVMTAALGKPVLCASCHASNALPGTGVTGISALTSAIHTKHGGVTDPVQLMTLDNIANRSSCYTCHPGSVTKCLRGAMGNAVDAAGNMEMGCQSCHGTMAAVGNPKRVGWLQQPNCQSCHHDGKRELSALTAGVLRTVTDTRFATNPNTPAAGFSLFRFSKGHGNLQCEACHGATHAEYPSSHANDNVLSQTLQGHTGTIRECTVCHAKVPNTVNGGPHGMHTIGSAWVSSHGDSAKNATACATCHGADYRGSAMSQVKMAKSFKAENKTVGYTAGQNVGCYDCHNGPKGG